MITAKWILVPSILAALAMAGPGNRLMSTICSSESPVCCCDSRATVSSESEHACCGDEALESKDVSIDILATAEIPCCELLPMPFVPMVAAQSEHSIQSRSPIDTLALNDVDACLSPWLESITASSVLDCNFPVISTPRFCLFSAYRC